MMMLVWSIFGALIGATAAQRRGFSVLVGILGGALLGPFAILMFLVSGVTSGDKQRKCPFCAEWVKPEATVCKHCHKDLPAVTAAGARR